MTDDYKRWIAEVTGGTIKRFDRISSGSSRGTWLVDVELPAGRVRELILRRDTGDGPLSGTEISLEREGRVYAALSSTAVRIPTLIATSADGEALLVERAVGSEDLAALQPSERAAIMRAFIEQLAVVHLIDVDHLELPGFARPSRPEDLALCDLDVWQRVFDARVKRPAPLWRFVFSWLRAHAPASADRTVLCHGDAGPGNFLYVDGDVTALLDWEFAHLGDPMDDLAWLTLRCYMRDFGDPDFVADRFAEYAHATGWKVDVDRVRYYQLFVMLRMAVACLVALEQRRGTMDASLYLMWLPLLARLATSRLLELEELPPVPPRAPVPAPPAPRAEVFEVISSDLTNVLMPELSSEMARSRTLGMSVLLSHLEMADCLGPEIDAADLDDLATLLGRRPSSVDSGLAEFDAMLRDDRAPTSSDVFGFLARHAERHVALWPLVAPMASKPLAPGTES